MMDFLCDSRFLVFPVSPAAQPKTLQIYRQGALVLDLRIRLDYVRPDRKVYVNVERFRGQTLSLDCSPRMPLKIRKADRRVPEPPVGYDDFRPVFHFAPPDGWLNDPNGLFFYKGKYHLFYQHNPVGTEWNNIHWGHAVSTDLLHWNNLECALYPDRLGCVYSGSGIVDSRNAAGLKSGPEDAVLLFYTAAGGQSALSKGQRFTQCLAYSTDGGNSFRPFAGNPVIPHLIGENRDPKVIFHRQTGRYILCLFLDGHQYALYASADLTHWRMIQKIDVPGEAECPDFYPICCDGDPAREKWVLSGASDRYVIGRFDGYRFEAETGVKRLHYGQNSYAAQSWSDIPAHDGRRLRIAWNTFDIPLAHFNHFMTFPCRMQLKTIGGEPALCASPIREIRSLYAESFTAGPLTLAAGAPFCKLLCGRAYDIELTAADAESAECRISLFGITVECHAQSHQIRCLGSTAPLACVDGNFHLRLLVDTAGIEIFANEGNVYLSNGFFMDPNLNTMEIQTDGPLRLTDLRISRIEMN